MHHILLAGVISNLAFDPRNLWSSFWQIWYNYNCQYLFPTLCGQIEDEDSGSRDEDTGEKQVEKVVEGFPPNNKVICDIKGRLWSAVKVKNITAVEEIDDFPLAIRDKEVHVTWWGFACDIQLKIWLIVHINIELQIRHTSLCSDEKIWSSHQFLLFDCYAAWTTEHYLHSLYYDSTVLWNEVLIPHSPTAASLLSESWPFLICIHYHEDDWAPLEAGTNTLLLQRINDIFELAKIS